MKKNKKMKKYFYICFLGGCVLFAQGLYFETHWGRIKCNHHTHHTDMVPPPPPGYTGDHDPVMLEIPIFTMSMEDYLENNIMDKEDGIVTNGGRIMVERGVNRTLTFTLHF